ncbi:dienelactone hydrolase family protein [Methylomonas sp. LL1]|uniref:dienelactone hydrolase family protein n=1 Tax=Methylomonas sp. LL1 TaxID=2785785 RepID=UPI0018C3E3AD|nr:dienelactone hydrolase family protein [Methylomonas sp. LL1]QPK63698.1 dienelactone hydrolase family protein [Methylomonas sp. LL1]
MNDFFTLVNLPSALCLGLVLLLQGCATPSEKFITTATRMGFGNQLVDGMDHRHRLFSNNQAHHADAIEELHVYLDGDGTPWTRTGVADDPTPRNPLILELMATDPAASILLGRPCYYEISLSHSCNNSLWTSHRYSAEVVSSMQTALENWLSTKKVKKLVLIGFSGGGTLATLLATRIKNTSAVVTIAANLNVKAWSDYHGYLQPAGSLNPINDAHIPASVRQIHLAGLKDDNVPAKIIESFSLTQQNALYLAQPEYEHACCWIDIWPMILQTYLNQHP